MIDKIQFVTGIHGNEPMPVLALASMGVDQIVAHPEALDCGVRFIEKDLNSSFGLKGNSPEEKRAQEILKQIDKDKIVVDFHTFSAVSEPFVILVDLKMLDFASSLGFKHIVYMKHNIKAGRSLINQVDGVSVEVGMHKDPESFKNTINLVKRIKNDKPQAGKIKLYEVYGIIEKKGEYINFKEHSDGFVPVLSGENAYSHHGLKAKLMSIK